MALPNPHSGGKTMNRRHLLTTLSAAGAGLAISGNASGAEQHPPQPPGTAPANPLAGPFAHLCGIHVAKNNWRLQFIVQHYCVDHRNHSGGGLFQCLLFDSQQPQARLLGVEYIISDKQYRDLPPPEQKYWHPHAYEILAGGLIIPGMEPAAETAHLGGLLNTWGKTWHTWPDPTTDVPVGEPLLMWSLGGDGQADERILAQRDRQFGVSASELRERRCRDLRLEVPQVSFPQSIDQVGRQWTDLGPDQPTRRP
jgi:Protein of unknown function (DUF1264)